MRDRIPTSIPFRQIVQTFFLVHLFASCEMPADKDSKSKDMPIAIKLSIPFNEICSSIQLWMDTNSTNELPIPLDSTLHPKSFRAMYANHQGKPFWLTEDGIISETKILLEELQHSNFDGLQPSTYQLDFLEDKFEKLQKSSLSTEDLIAFECQLSAAFLQLSNDLLFGKQSSLNENKDWKNKNDTLIDVYSILPKTLTNKAMKEAFDFMRPQHRYYNAFRNEYKKLDSISRVGGYEKIKPILDTIAIDSSAAILTSIRKRLYHEIGIPSDTLSTIWKEDVVQAIKKFQYINGLKQTGKLDSSTTHQLNIPLKEKLEKLALNMERMRWLKHDFKQPYIWVDVPKMELDYIEKDSILFSMKTVVGRPSRPTTMLDAKLENIVFSPPWTVPPTIMKEEVVPGIARRGGSYLARRGLKAYDRRGRVVSASAINAKNYRRYTIGQAPGYRSSLGEVKFNLPNPWSIYLHDTPHREDFVKYNRALSSGCIRVHKPKEFAAFLLDDSVEYSYSKIDSICKKRKTIFVPMKRQVMVHIVYLTNALDSTGQVMYLKDIYKWDKRI
jgi:murein L,D-transpeptidase YcbB/YkuD